MEVKSTIRYETYTMTPEEEIKWLRQCVRELQEEKQKLEKQLEDTIKSYTDENNLRHEIDLKLDIAKTQQKEFIKYLEDCISELKKESMNKLENTLNLGIADITKEILLKYKEIVGSKNNGN